MQSSKESDGDPKSKEEKNTEDKMQSAEEAADIAHKMGDEISEDITQSAEKLTESEPKTDKDLSSDGTSKEKPKYKRILGNKFYTKPAKKKYIKYQLKIQMKYGKEPRFEDLAENDDFEELLAECKRELEQEDVQTKINEAKQKAEEAKKQEMELAAEEAKNDEEADKSNEDPKDKPLLKKHLCESHKKKWIKYQLKIQEKYGTEPRYGDLLELPNFNELFETCKKELQREHEYHKKLKDGGNDDKHEDCEAKNKESDAKTEDSEAKTENSETKNSDSQAKNASKDKEQKPINYDAPKVVPEQHSEFIIFEKQATEQLPSTEIEPVNIEQQTESRQGKDVDLNLSGLSTKQKQKLTRSQLKRYKKWVRSQETKKDDSKTVQEPPKISKTVNEPPTVSKTVKEPPTTSKTVKEPQNISKTVKEPQNVSKTVKEPQKITKTIPPVKSQRMPTKQKTVAESNHMKRLLSQVTQIIQMQNPLQFLQNQQQKIGYKWPSGIPRSFLIPQIPDNAPSLSKAPAQPANTMPNQGHLTEAYRQFPQIPPDNPMQTMTLNLKSNPTPTSMSHQQMATLHSEQPTQPYLQQFNQNQPMFLPNNPMYQPEQPMFRPLLPTYIANQPIFESNPVVNQPMLDSNPMANQTAFEPHYLNQPSSSNQHLLIQTDYGQNEPTVNKQMYSPTDVYLDGSHEEEKHSEELREGSDSPDFITSGQKRLSAFERLGPLTEAKKPKLTINLIVNKDEAVREVVGETKSKVSPPKSEYIPFHLRPEVTTCTDETVMKYLVYWPWKKNLSVKKIVSARHSKTVMIMEQEQMEEIYVKDTAYLQISVTGYPKTWKKEQVLDALLNAVKGKSFIPCFINFTETECQFLVIRNYSALIAIHKMNFAVQTDTVELKISIIDRGLSLNHLDFLPRLILSKRMTMGYDGTKKLSLKAFTLQDEVSHFIYFPLHRHTNQAELVQIQSVIVWDFITDLDLSHNKLRTIDGFDLTLTCPRLKHLDLSYNCLEKVTVLLRIRSLPLNSLKLEGNPLVLDYIDCEHYVKVLRMMFSTLREIDGVKFKLKGELPSFERNYCPEECYPIVSKFLETFFPLMDSPIEDRPLMENLYDEYATLTITYKYKLRYSSVFRYFRNIFLRSRILEEGDMDSIRGASSICKHYSRWPALKHDPCTFTVDVVWYNESSLIIRVSGILKLTAETLAEDEEILAFTRTFVLRSDDGIEYKIENEMVYWENATDECINNAFKITTLKPKRLSLKLDSTPDDDLKENLTILFMKLTNMDKKPSQRCLELKDWNFKNALQLFYKLLQVNNLDYLLEDKKT